jgi:carboxymethylenebutenolidase
MGEIVSFPSSGGNREGYAESLKPNRSAVSLIEEWWGLVGHIRDVADRFGLDRRLTPAPDLDHGAQTLDFLAARLA